MKGFSWRGGLRGLLLIMALAVIPGETMAARSVTLEAGRVRHTITLTDALPPILKTCLFGEEHGGRDVITQQWFTEHCAAPYIHGLWLDPTIMLRTLRNIAEQATDKLVVRPRGAPFPVFYPPAVADAVLARLEMPLAAAPNVVAKPLPSPLPAPSLSNDNLYNNIGLLFLPNDYVVPGETFNEMYGWDSFLIIKGLLASVDAILSDPETPIWSETDRAFIRLVDDPTSSKDYRAYANRLFRIAKGMVDNHIFQIAYYGGYILNANRTYYLTRSDPPLFTQEALAVLASANRHGFSYSETLAPYLSLGRDDFVAPRTWEEWVREEVLPAAKMYYAYWTDPKRIRPGSFSNPRVRSVNHAGQVHDVYVYGTDGVGPAPEVARSTQPQNRKVYTAAARDFEDRPELNPDHLFFNDRTMCLEDRLVAGCGDSVYGLTQAFYAADRAMRASGFDLSGRFGPHGEWALNYASIALNVLLLTMAEDIDAMANLVGEPPAQGAAALAERRRFLARFFARPCGDGYGDRYIGARHRRAVPEYAYAYATQFYLLWAGILADADARRDLVRALGAFLPVDNSDDGPDGGVDRYGVPPSLARTGMQWDQPYAWAPIQYFAADGLARAGFQDEAARVMLDWMTAVNLVFADTGVLLEKYDAEHPAKDARVAVGYANTQRGFGWTNAVYLLFANQLYGTSPSGGD